MGAKNLFDYSESFADRRHGNRCNFLSEKMFERRSAVIQQFCEGNKETTAARRFFNNQSISLYDQINALTKKVTHVNAGEVLLIEDGSELNYTSKRGRIISGSLGPLTSKYCTGFFLHPCLVVDTKTTIPIGFSAVEIWKRDQDAGDKHQRNYSKLPIEKKESWKWIECIQKSKEILPADIHKIVVADREADIYKVYTLLKDETTDLLIRAKADRNIHGGGTVNTFLNDQPVKKTVSMIVRGDEKDGRSKHKASLEIKYGHVEIKKPRTASNKGEQDYFGLYVVEIKEKKNSVKRGEKPVHWIIFTTLPVTSNKKAETVLKYYSKRWLIEELFGILKSRGLNLEDSQLTSGEALMKLTVVAMDVGLKILQLTKGREDEETKAEVIFSKVEIALISLLIPEYEGDTEKQKNPYKNGSLAWAAWLIGRLGGWMGYKKMSPPGNKTMARGLDRFNAMLIGYKIKR
jgi:hypothetical protein